MGRKPNTYNQILEVLRELHTLYPSFNMGRHLATALEDYQDFWGIPDTELLYALQKYKANLEFNEVPIASDNDIEKIIKDGMDLSNVVEESEDNY